MPGYGFILGSHGVAGWVESWTGDDVPASKGEAKGGAKGEVKGGGSCQNTASTSHPCTPGEHKLPIHKTKSFWTRFLL